MVLGTVLLMSLLPLLSVAQTKPRRTPVPAAPPPVGPAPVLDNDRPEPLVIPRITFKG
jgi:hypothetical protein